MKAILLTLFMVSTASAELQYEKEYEPNTPIIITYKHKMEGDTRVVVNWFPSDDIRVVQVDACCAHVWAGEGEHRLTAIVTTYTVKKVTIEGEEVEILVGGVSTSQHVAKFTVGKPEPPAPPTPPEPPASDLFKTSSDAAKATGDPATANQLAIAYALLCVRDYTSVAELGAEMKAVNDTILKDKPQWLLYRTTIGTALAQMMREGKLLTVAQYKEAVKEIVGGLRDSIVGRGLNFDITQILEVVKLVMAVLDDGLELADLMKLVQLVLSWFNMNNFTAIQQDVPTMFVSAERTPECFCPEPCKCDPCVCKFNASPEREDLVKAMDKKERVHYTNWRRGDGYIYDHVWASNAPDLILTRQELKERGGIAVGEGEGYWLTNETINGKKYKRVYATLKEKPVLQQSTGSSST